jgi:hypothetical protein
VKSKLPFVTDNRALNVAQAEVIEAETIVNKPSKKTTSKQQQQQKAVIIDESADMDTNVRAPVAPEPRQSSISKKPTEEVKKERPVASIKKPVAEEVRNERPVAAAPSKTNVARTQETVTKERPNARVSDEDEMQQEMSERASSEQIETDEEAERYRKHQNEMYERKWSEKNENAWSHQQQRNREGFI